MNCGKPPTSLPVGEVGFIQFDRKDLDVDVQIIDWKNYGASVSVPEDVYEMVRKNYDIFWEGWKKTINEELLGASASSAISEITHHHDPQNDTTIIECPHCGYKLTKSEKA